MVPAGLNTALKPAHEPIVMARKPLAGTVAANVERFGTGALNVDACRLVAGGPSPSIGRRQGKPGGHPGEYGATITNRITPERFAEERPAESLGRWPANVMLDEEAAEMLDGQSGERPSSSGIRPRGTGNTVYGRHRDTPFDSYGDSGGASRFFYCAKSSRAERERGCGALLERSGVGTMAGDADGSLKTGSGNERNTRARNHHPTVKPVALMRWLVRLVTPPGGLVLDPFMGSGTTGIAAVQEGRAFVGVEREPEYHAIAEARIAHARGEVRPDAEQPGLDFGGAA